MSILTRFWIEFNFGDDAEDYASYVGLERGCGVTARDLNDAIELLRVWIFKGDPLPEIKNVNEDIDVSTLDAGHILPNIGIPSDRGIWYPAIWMNYLS